VFRYNEHANISSLDPAFAKDQRNIWACHQLYNTLIELDESLHIQPSIAHDWEISEDGVSYTFYLRDDVYFHENEVFGDKKTRKLTAHDAVFSLERLRDPTIASSGSWILQPVNKIKAINDTTLQIQCYAQLARYHLLLW
jgi:peptide/nickel transport system substrate-binding protein